MIGDDKYHVTFDKDNIVDELGKLSTPICYYIKDNLIHVVAILNSGDKVVANTDELKSLLLEISMHFEEYQEAIEGIKLSTGKVKTFNNAKK